MINLKEGKLYITDCKGTTSALFNLDSGVEALEVDLNENPDFVLGPLGHLPDITFTATMKTTKEQYFRMIDTFTGLFKMICVICPNKRVIHLAIHGKKRRTRKKNRNRAIRILEKEAQHAI